MQEGKAGRRKSKKKVRQQGKRDLPKELYVQYDELIKKALDSEQPIADLKKLKKEVLKDPRMHDGVFDSTLWDVIRVINKHVESLTAKQPATQKAKQPAGKNKSNTRSARAGLVFPVGRIHRYLKESLCVGGNARTAGGAPVYLAAVIEYLTKEVLDLAGTSCKDHKRGRIIPRDIFLAVRNDEELDKLCKNVAFMNSGAMQAIHKSLFNKGSAAWKKAHEEQAHEEQAHGKQAHGGAGAR